MTAPSRSSNATRAAYHATESRAITVQVVHMGQRFSLSRQRLDFVYLVMRIVERVMPSDPKIVHLVIQVKLLFMANVSVAVRSVTSVVE